MGVGRAPEPLEPVLIEKGGERGLAELRLPDYPEQRGFRLILLTRQWGEHSRARGRIAVASIRAGPEPKIDEPPPLRWGEHEMSGLVQDDIGLCLAVERTAVPIERAHDPIGIDCHPTPARQRVL